MLIEKVRLNMVKESHKYSMSEIWSEPMLYKFIMSRASVDTWGTLFNICENSVSLDIYIVKVSNNQIQWKYDGTTIES